MSDQSDSVLAAMASRLGLDELTPPMREAVEELTARARNEVPGLEPSAARWADRIAESLGEVDASQWPERVGRLRAGEMWLCAALCDGDSAAVSEFFTRYGDQIDRVARRLADDADQYDELRQLIRIRLLVAEPPRVPQIAGYRGRGSLAAWVRTLAARTGLNAIRDAKRSFRADLVSRELVQSAGFSSLGADLRLRFVAYLEQALAALQQQQRLLLRLKYYDAMSLAALARVYDVHESTMSRRLSAARRACVEAFESIARRTLDPSGVRDLLTVLEDGIELSLTSLFRSADTR